MYNDGQCKCSFLRKQTETEGEGVTVEANTLATTCSEVQGSCESSHSPLANFTTYNAQYNTD